MNIMLISISITQKIRSSAFLMKIKIIPIGSLNSHVLDYLKRILSKRFKIDTEVSSQLSIDVFKKNDLRDQYLSTSMLHTLADMKRSKSNALLGVTDVDLYVPSLNFIFGEANLLNRVAVISIIRLRQSFYGLKDDNEVLLKREGKEAVHELGHIFNLKHCHIPKCVMFFSNSLKDTDVKGDDLCDNCREALNTNFC